MNESRADPDHRRLRSRGGGVLATIDPVGARIASLVHGPSGIEFLLRTPWEAEAWSGAFAAANSSAEWHRRYAGGWHTLVPHAGEPRAIDGVEHPFHGEAAWRRWRVVSVSDASCTLQILLRTVPLRFTREIAVTDAGVEVTQSVENLSKKAVAFTWTEHPAFGEALIGPGTTVTVGGVPTETRFPADGQTHSGFQDLRVERGPSAHDRGVAEVRNPDTGAAARLRWDADVFPHLYIWQEHGASTGFPWWGLVNTIGIEPASRRYFAGDDAPLGPLRVDGHGTFTSRLALDLEGP